MVLPVGLPLPALMIIGGSCLETPRQMLPLARGKLVKVFPPASCAARPRAGRLCRPESGADSAQGKLGSEELHSAETVCWRRASEPLLKYNSSPPGWL